MNISDYFLLVTYHPRFLGEIVNGRKGVHARYISKLQTKQNVTVVFFWSNTSNTLSNKNEVGAKWPGKRSTVKNFKIKSFLRRRLSQNDCLVPRRLSRAQRKAGRRQQASPAVCTLPMVPCGSSPVARLYLAKNEAPEEEAVKGRSSERARRSYHWFRSALIWKSGPTVCAVPLS